MAERTRRVEDLRCVPAQRRPGAFCVRSRSAAAAAKVGMLLERRLSASGSPPARASLRLARAWTRASLRGTSGNPPSPSSCRRNTCRPGRQWRETLSVSACNHRRDALTNLLTVLYGRRAAAELVDLVRFTRPAPRPQWLDRTQIADAPAQLTPGSTTVVRLTAVASDGLAAVSDAMRAAGGLPPRPSVGGARPGRRHRSRPRFGGQRWLAGSIARP